MSLSRSQPLSRNQEATIYIGNLDEAASEALLYELFLQASPVVHVHIPRDRITQAHQGYGFVEFRTEEDADYAIKIMNGIRLHGKVLRINRSSQDKKTLDVGANLFVGNLAPDADEKVLFDTFIMFGRLIETPKVARDETTGVSRGYAFISYDSFESSDAAIEAMNGQYLCNRPITVNYAFKKDGKGERHGTAAERLLAAQNRQATMAAGGGGGSGMSSTLPGAAPSTSQMPPMGQPPFVSPVMGPYSSMMPHGVMSGMSGVPGMPGVPGMVLGAPSSAPAGSGMPASTLHHPPGYYHHQMAPPGMPYPLQPGALPLQYYPASPRPIMYPNYPYPPPAPAPPPQPPRT